MNKLLIEMKPFEYDDNLPTGHKMLREFMNFWTLENGAKYEGELNPLTNVREGRGIQIWPDGSWYDG